MKTSELNLYTAKGRVNGRVTFVIHVVGKSVNDAWMIAQSWGDKQQLGRPIDWDFPRQVQSRAPMRVIVGRDEA